MSELERGSHVAVAFGLVLGSALSTGIGASAVFFPSIVKLTSTRVLASSLAFAAGVMIYVSLLEIIVKSQMSFLDSGYSEGKAHLFSTICFFCGILCMMLVEKIVHSLGGGDHEHSIKKKEIKGTENKDETEQQPYVVPHCIGCSDDPKTELEEWHARAANEVVNETNPHAENETSDETMTMNDAIVKDNNVLPPNNVIFEGKDPESGTAPARETPGSGTAPDDKDGAHSDLSSNDDYQKRKDKIEKARLIRMGANTALAIAIHNFPEGLATFVAALDDPKVGAVLAVALGIHNIPEGLCVALPVYYATGNRLKGFLWGLLSGLTEPIGALIGWLALANIMRDEVYAVLFGLVAGMMTYISFRELIPTAFIYDTKDTVVTHATVLGMLVMAISLVLFKL